jgi:hypothetical protein
VRLREAVGFPVCPFCGVGLTLDRTDVRPHYLYRPRVTPLELTSLLRRWADRHGVKPPVGPVSPRVVYYPFWRYVREGPRKLVPAWSTPDPALGDLRPPDAEQVFFDASHVQGVEVVDAAIPEAAARARAFGEATAPPGDLVHLPFYDISVRLGELRRRLTIDACSGTVLTPEGEPAPGPRTSVARHVLALTGGGLVMSAAAATIRPLESAAAVVAALAAVLYIVLRGESRRRGA